MTERIGIPIAVADKEQPGFIRLFKPEKKICLERESEFFRPIRISVRQWDARSFCGYKCARLAHKRALRAGSTQMDESLWAERFWQKVDKSNTIIARPGLQPCWLWTGATANELGYGVINVGGKIRRATHMAIWIATGKWPRLQALHECDNPPCVRFDHLREGTQLENVRDCIARGRFHNQAQWRAT